MSCILVDATQRLATVGKDQFAKKKVVYIVTDRSREWFIMCQSLPLLAKWINDHVCEASSERVSVTGLFENMNRTDGRHGGWHKGRFRIQVVALNNACAVFEHERAGFAKAVVIAGMPQRYVTISV